MLFDAPAPGPGVCLVCRGPVNVGAEYCWCCRRVCAALGVPVEWVPPVTPIRVYGPGDPWSAVLRRYKDAPVVAARRHFADVLAADVDRFFDQQGESLRSLIGDFDAYCVVPSSRQGRLVEAAHPLMAVLRQVRHLRSVRAVHLVSRVGVHTGHLRPATKAFELAAPKTALRVLVIDDAWVTGARALSAVAALRSGGVPVAGALVLGRCVDPAASVRSRRWWEAVGRSCA
jgi:hypothetical protein